MFRLYQSVTFSVIDNSLGLTILSLSSLLNLDRVQNAAVRVILGTIKDTMPIEAMNYLLDLPPVETRQKLEQAKPFLNATQNPKKPHHDSVREEIKGLQIGNRKATDGPGRAVNLACFHSR